MTVHPELRTILFDAVGTLIYADPPVGEVYHQAGLRFGSRLDFDMVSSRLRAAMAQQERNDATANHRTSEVNERRRWHSIVAAVFLDVPDSTELFEFLWNHFAQPQHWRIYDDVADCWRRLTNGGYQLGIASNFDERLEVLGKELFAGDGFDGGAATPRLFVSSREGCKKPGLAFFRSIERALGLSPRQIMLVGDDLENDYLAARRAEWQAVLLDRTATQTGLTVSPSIHTLDEVPRFLAGTERRESICDPS